MSLPIMVSNVQVITSGDMSGNITSSVVDISEAHHYAVHAIWTGSPAGNIIIEGSNDNSTYTQISSTAAGGAAGSLLSNQANAAYKYVRIRYAVTSSTGVLNVHVSVKRN